MHQYTMHGFDQNNIDPYDTVPGRTLKYLLRVNLPQLQSRIQARIEQAFAEEMKGKDGNEGNISLPPNIAFHEPSLCWWVCFWQKDGRVYRHFHWRREWPDISITKWLSVTGSVITRRRINSTPKYMRGNESTHVKLETASNPKFSQAAMRYSHDVVIAMEICRHMPAILRPYVLLSLEKFSGWN